MAISTGGSGRGRAKYRPMAEINVTPMVDVMLVLLIVFMVAAPLLTVGVPVQLPEAKSRPLTGDKEPLTVTIDKEGTVYLQETEVGLEELVPRLQAIAENGYEERIYVRGDTNANYGAVMQVMARMNDAGFTRLGLVNTAPHPDKK